MFSWWQVLPVTVTGESELTQLKNNYSRKKKTKEYYYIAESNGNRDISDKAVLRSFAAAFFFLPLTETPVFIHKPKLLQKAKIYAII